MSRAFRANDAKGDGGRVADERGIEQFDLIDAEQLGFERHFFAFARHFVGAAPADFAGREGRRHLHDVANKLL